MSLLTVEQRCQCTDNRTSNSNVRMDHNSHHGSWCHRYRPDSIGVRGLLILGINVYCDNPSAGPGDNVCSTSNDFDCVM